jgi:Flp pilus assembly protein TadD
MYFPKEFRAEELSAGESKRLTAEGYSALLASKPHIAEELFESAVEALPSNPKAHRGLAITHMRLQRISQAIGAYLLYLELNPNAPDAAEVDRVLVEYWKSRCGDCNR